MSSTLFKVSSSSVKLQELEERNRPEVIEICEPIAKFEDLLDWMPKKHLAWQNQVINKAQRTSYKIAGFGQNCHLSENIYSPSPRIINRTAPKTIFCHDFKGGYLDDRFVNGTCDFDDDYTFFHWAGIDTFIYFSHFLVTIPPLTWLNAGHRNGVRVLGTFITENKEGEKIMGKIIKSDSIMDKVIENLVKICDFFHFDGYLLNIENSVESGEKLVEFVKKLKLRLANVCGDDTEVIWYDAVTYSGKLEWQNKLNYSNKEFFDVCDGIYLNYGWKPEELVKTAILAGSRQHDVYVGIDVFGRGCFGGGGFATYKAVEKVNSAGLSVALFAPSWTHECCPVDSNFLWRETYFWHKIWKYLFICGPASIPFSTTFCVGKGTKKFFRGRVVGDKPWYNLSEQELQISTPYCVRKNDTEVEVYSSRCLRVFFKDAYSGGSCVIISRANDFDSELLCFIRLFACELTSDKILSVSFSTKTISSDLHSSLSLVFVVENEVGTLRRHILTPENAFKVLTAQAEQPNIKILFNDSRTHIQRIKKPPIVEDRGWNTYNFDFSLGSSTIVEIGVFHLGISDILLGNISIGLEQEIQE